MSILRWKQKVMYADGGVLRDSGGGGGGGAAPAPTQSTSYNTNVPEYAKPYVETMLGATQKQLFDMSDGQITGFKPYTPYSTDVSSYVAPFSPLQQQAMRGTAELQQPGQFGTATGLTGLGAAGAFGLAGRAAGAGGEYAQAATTPGIMQAYMSPYMQNVVDYQKAQALRDYQMAAPMRARAAVGAGAFGGTRQAIESAEAQRNLMSQLQGIEATGAQQAFQQAQQAQQFGANLGLQGLQAGLGGIGQAVGAAGQLGQLGTSQQAADLARLQAQQQMGSLQQQQEQQKINQAIQNYAIQQQYPLMQLGFMSNMLRGLPLQSQTTQLYQAQPTTTQQAVGLLGAGASLFGGRAAGGAIKEYRKGGIASVPGYKYGDLISTPKLESMADNLSVPQLQERLKDPQLTDEERRIFQSALQEKLQEEARGTEARMAGIAMAGGPAFATQGMAGGGIVAFGDPELNPDEDQVVKDRDRFLSFEEKLQRAAAAPKTPFQYDSLASKLGQFPSKLGQFQPAKKYTPEQLDEIARGQGVFPEGSPALPDMPPVAEAKPAEKKEDKGVAKEGAKPAAAAAQAKEKTAAEFLAERKAMGPQGKFGAEFEQYLTERLGKQAERSAAEERERKAQFFLEMGSDPMGYLAGATKGAKGYVSSLAASRKAEDAIQAEAQKARMELDKARRAEERGDVEGAQQAYDNYQNRINRIQAAQISAGAAGQAQRFEREAVEQYMKDNPGTTFSDAYAAIKGAGKLESNSITAIKAAIAAKQADLYSPGVTKEGRARIQQEIAGLQQKLVSIGMGNMIPGGGIGGGQGGGGQGPGILRFDAQGNPIRG